MSYENLITELESAAADPKNGLTGRACALVSKQLRQGVAVREVITPEIVKKKINKGMASLWTVVITFIAYETQDLWLSVLL